MCYICYRHCVPSVAITVLHTSVTSLCYVRYRYCVPSVTVTVFHPLPLLCSIHYRYCVPSVIVTVFHLLPLLCWCFIRYRYCVTSVTCYCYVNVIYIIKYYLLSRCRSFLEMTVHWIDMETLDRTGGVPRWAADD